MKDLIDNIHKWLKRNKTGGSPEPERSFTKREKHWFMQKVNQKQSVTKEPRKPICLFCEKDHWGDTCTEYDTLEECRNYFVEHKLCFNCEKKGHMANKCRSRGCYKCTVKHHTSLCDYQSLTSDVTDVVTGYTPSVEEQTLPVIVPVKIQGVIFWAYLDTGSGRNFISSDAIERLNLKPDHYETHQLITVNGAKKQSMPISNLYIDSIDGQTREKIEVSGSK